MPSPTFLTWDGSPENNISPYRPGTEDVGNDTLSNDPSEPPDEETMPGALGWNQRAKQISAIGRVVPAGGVSVTFSGGTPSLLKQTFARGTAPAGLQVTDNGVGDTSITWSADQFPVSVLEPHGATLNTALGFIRAYAITNGVRVVTQNTAAAAADIGFTVCFG